MKLQVELQPFIIPSYVLEKTRPGKRQDGIQHARSHDIEELDVETLGQLCDEFRAGVFAKAGKADPGKATSPA